MRMYVGEMNIAGRQSGTVSLFHPVLSYPTEGTFFIDPIQ
jgi:hypothetical protein